MTTVKQNKIHVSARVGEYNIPPMKDMLVLGKRAPIGCIAMRRALDLLIKTPFEHIEIEDDDVISDILVRKPLLKRIGKDELIKFVLRDVKPLLSPEELLHVELEIDVILSGSL